MPSEEQRQDTVLKALSVALQHSALAANQQNICRILQVCKAWRGAVQESGACLTRIQFGRRVYTGSDETPKTLLEDAILFAHWVSTYAGTVRSIDLLLNHHASASTSTSSVKASMQRALALGLKTATTRIQTVATAQCGSAASEAMRKGQLVLQPLRLQSLRCCSPLVSPLVLSALPAATLTALSMTLPTSTVQLQGAMSTLSNLRRLVLESDQNRVLPAGCLIGISKHTQLTFLSLDSLDSTAGLALLPRQLRHLHLSLERNADEPVTVNLLHLAQLQQLVAMAGQVHSFAVPQGLQGLSVCCSSPAVAVFNMTSLQQLRHLVIGCSQDQPEGLLALTQSLQHLNEMKLYYSDVTTALAAAATWSQIKQLVGLRLPLSGPAEAIANVISAVSSLTSLTKLALVCDLKITVEVGAALEPARQQLGCICQSLQHLTQLGELTMRFANCGDLPQEDILHLSSLTGLTTLMLISEHALDNAMLIALLLRLTGLQELNLSKVSRVYVLPVIGNLQRLTELRVTGLSREQQISGLSHLTGLSNLRKLLGFEHCSQTDFDKYWFELEVCD